MNVARSLGSALCIGMLAACTTTTVTNSSGDVVTKGSERAVARASEADVRTRARARVDLAAGYYRSGQIAIALEEARRATSIDPAFADAYGLLGLIHMDMGEKNPDGTPALMEFLHLEYADKAVLYVPVSQLQLIGRYTGASSALTPV